MIVSNLTFGDLGMGGYRTVKDSQGKDLWDKVKDTNELTTRNPTLENQIKLTSLKFHAESGRNLYQSYTISSSFPVFVPIFVPILASLTDIKETKKYTLYSDWDSSAKGNPWKGQFVPIKETDWSDILAYLLGGGMAGMQQSLIWYCLSKKVDDKE